MNDKIETGRANRASLAFWFRAIFLFPLFLLTALGLLCYIAYSSSPSVFKNSRLSWIAHQGPVNCLAFSPDGKTLVSGCGYENVILWDPTTAKKKSAIPQSAFSTAFSPDGDTLAIGQDGRVFLWGWRATEARATLNVRKDVVRSLAFSPRGELLASSGTTVDLMLWDTAKGKERARLRPQGSSFRYSIMFSPDGKTLASGGNDGLILLWDISTGRNEKLLGHQNEIKFVGFTPDGHTFISGSQDGVVRLWDFTTRKKRAMRQASGRIWSMALSPDGRTLALSLSGKLTVELWDVATGKTRAIFTGFSDFVDSLAFSPDSRTLATGSVDHIISLWDVPQQ